MKLSGNYLKQSSDKSILVYTLCDEEWGWAKSCEATLLMHH